MSDDTNDKPVAAPAIHKGISRRLALQMAGAAGGSAFLTQLAAAGGAAAQTANDYKALVCVFLYGGNDQSNTVIPYDVNAYARYQLARPTLAIPRNNLLTINPVSYTGPALGLSPHLRGIRGLFGQGKAAIIANVGTLAYPVTRAQYEGNSRPLPFQLFSHSDQTGQWQSGLPDKASRTGWLGRIGDMMAPGFNSPNAISIAMSIAGNNAIQAGSSTIQYQITPWGPIRIDPINSWGPLWQAPQATENIRSMLLRQNGHMISRGFSAIYNRAVESEQKLSRALEAAPTLTTPFPNNYLGAQARMVARLISIQQQLGQRRQIYFIAAGGYDFHDNLLTEQGERLTELDGAITALYKATEEMGLASNVTTFTASDFGRALQHNGRGSDHGWGSHHFVVGGAVRGRRVVGKMPTVDLDTDTDAGQGRLIPTTSVDQYAATLARWFGVPASEIATIMPNIGRFSNSNLGFMA
ncbi:hypothetical protein ABAC460_16445 [Asticcacaulis sp. AC460]|uniref:DUF1501 domain-containing protein n=1 Tax=Asticcacaulis sp. AC460 TaxID=1282360 RepID=UPI0003C3B0FE|nr:DUF1501 domain-containing protein [Asticcacaulis sp. AC460]ESQ88248.1 hypothetical protein ABAC460_16445 [Asticcacaulis sp. AC460]